MFATFGSPNGLSSPEGRILPIRGVTAGVRGQYTVLDDRRRVGLKVRDTKGLKCIGRDGEI